MWSTRNTSIACTFVFALLAACSNDGDGPPGFTPPPVDECGTLDPSDDASSAEDLSLGAVQRCRETSGSNVCLERVFRKYLQTHTVREATAELQRYIDSDTSIRLGCHPIAHAIGREAFLKHGTVHDSFDACDQTCHSGCYHGAMERFLRGDAACGEHVFFDELEMKAATACDPELPFTQRFQCLHGLGHALLYFSGYDLVESLLLCDATGDGWSQSSCYGGVFMENIVAAEPELRDLSPSDPHYPCSVLDERYRADCYLMQTSRMSEMGLSSAEILVACRDAGVHRLTCVQSMGRDLSNEARIGNPRTVSEICERGEADEQAACSRGVVYALVDNTWDGRYAMPFCATFREDADKAYCYDVTTGYLEGMFGKTEAELTDECTRYAPGEAACTEAIGP